MKRALPVIRRGHQASGRVEGRRNLQATCIQSNQDTRPPYIPPALGPAHCWPLDGNKSMDFHSKMCVLAFHLLQNHCFYRSAETYPSQNHWKYTHSKSSDRQYNWFLTSDPSKTNEIRMPHAPNQWKYTHFHSAD